jgi:glycosyltransferase involved in cell wall biosynthesis
MDRPLLLMLTQLPPPVHGVTVISKILVTSRVLRESFSLDVLPMHFASSVDDVDRVTLGKLLKSLALAASLFLKCTFRRPDLVYFTLTPTGRAFFRDLLYVAILKLARVRRAFHLHGTGVSSFATSRLRQRLYTWAFRNACIILLSPRLFEDIAAFVPPGSCQFLANGIADPLCGVPIARGESSGPLRILFLSRMVLSKGPIVLLRALARLKRQGVPFLATFAGGRFEFACRRQFDDILVAERLHDEVRYVGEVSGSEKADLLRDSDVLAFPSLYDAFGLVLLEAMAHGMPCVASNQGAIPDIVVDGVTGFIVPRGNDELLALKLALLAVDPELRRGMGKAGRNRFEQHFAAPIFERNAAAILIDCLERELPPKLNRPGDIAETPTPENMGHEQVKQVSPRSP